MRNKPWQFAFIVGACLFAGAIVIGILTSIVGAGKVASRSESTVSPKNKAKVDSDPAVAAKVREVALRNKKAELEKQLAKTKAAVQEQIEQAATIPDAWTTLPENVDKKYGGDSLAIVAGIAYHRGVLHTLEKAKFAEKINDPDWVAKVIATTKEGLSDFAVQEVKVDFYRKKLEDSRSAAFKKLRQLWLQQNDIQAEVDRVCQLLANPSPVVVE